MTKITFIISVLCFSNTMLLAQNAFWNTDSIRSAHVMKLVKSGVQNYTKFSSVGTRHPEKTDVSYDSTIYVSSGDSIVETSYFVFRGKYPKLSEQAVYSNDGNMRYYRSYGQTASLAAQAILYNKKGKRLRVFEKDENGRDNSNVDSLYLKELFEYDSSDNQISRSTYDVNGHIREKVAYHYKGGQLEELLNYSTMNYTSMPDSLDFREMEDWSKKQDLSFTSKTIRRIDSAARTEETDNLSGADSDLVLKVLDTYDEHWFLRRHDVYTIARQLHYYYLIECDEAGRKTEQKYFSKDDLLSTEKFKYDDSGRLIRSIKTEDGFETSRTEENYDASGNPIEEVQTNQHHATNRTIGKRENRKRFEYDAKGNLLQENESINGTPLFLTRYVYSYR